MRYHTSLHFHEDPLIEIESALAHNTPDSVKATLEARLHTERSYIPPNFEEIKRIQQQLAHVAVVTSQVEIAS